MIIRNGYYIAAQNLMCGDMELANLAKQIFDTFDLPNDKNGNYQGNKYDGVAFYQTEKMIVYKKIILQNFFVESDKVQYFMEN